LAVGAVEAEQGCKLNGQLCLLVSERATVARGGHASCF
jgi:hypothetical protein